MRRLFCCALLFLLTCAAAQTPPPKEWLAFQEEFKAFAAGPTGLYAAQDMQEINPGDSMHLPPAQALDKIRWTRGTAAGALATIPTGIWIERVFEGVPFLNRMGYVFLVLVALMVIISLLDKRGQRNLKPIDVDPSEFRTSGGFLIGMLLVLGIIAALYTLFW